MANLSKKVYFPHLNGLRFVAAILVVFHHIEQYKYYAGKEDIWGNVQVDNIGVKAVSVFFVLSGFLITYLLLAEHRRFGTISLENFYVRRILRIWPVYYLVVFLVLLLPYLIDLEALFGYRFSDKSNFIFVTLLLIMPNVTRLSVGNLIGGNQLWSIGVEEQFYIFWPICIRYFIHRLLPFLLVFIGAKFILTIVVEVAYAESLFSGGLHFVLEKLFFFLRIFKVEQMAIGAIGAYFLFRQHQRIIGFINANTTQLFTLLAIIATFVLKTKHWTYAYLEGILFAMLIINLATNRSLFFNLEHRLLSYLGNLSYGIYMYHTLIIALLIYLVEMLPSDASLSINAVLYAAAPALTILVSWISYESFEKYFLKLKTHFMKIKSKASAA